MSDWADFPWSATDGNTLSNSKNVKKGKLLSIDVNHKHKSLFMKLKKKNLNPKVFGYFFGLAFGLFGGKVCMGIGPIPKVLEQLLSSFEVVLWFFFGCLR